MTTLPYPVHAIGRSYCSECQCSWVMDDLSEPNRKQDSCAEPLRRGGCLCHSIWFCEGWLREKDVA